MFVYLWVSRCVGQAHARGVGMKHERNWFLERKVFQKTPHRPNVLHQVVRHSTGVVRRQSVAGHV